VRGVTTTDDRGVTYRFLAPPARIVSLVPSDTYTLLRLGAGARLVGRTRYCVEPAELVAPVPEMGGTKDVDVARVVEAKPDLVLMNREENTRAAALALEDAGVRVFATLPKTVSQGVALVARLAALLGEPTAQVKELVRSAYRTHAAAIARAEARAKRRKVFVPIWMEPLMTIHGDTFISNVLALVGADNAFADRERRFPLAADIGRARPMTLDEVGDRDTRYPRITLDEVRARRPDVVLLPDEPHPFGEDERKVFASLDIPAAREGRIRFVSGRDLMWPGLRSVEGLERVEASVFG
jgi:ABC-type Fe3+-hydroxamate transport system substrate-binding protein